MVRQSCDKILELFYVISHSPKRRKKGLRHDIAPKSPRIGEDDSVRLLPSKDLGVRVDVFGSHTTSNVHIDTMYGRASSTMRLFEQLPKIVVI